jgi:hypothetical protein
VPAPPLPAVPAPPLPAASAPPLPAVSAPPLPAVPAETPPLPPALVPPPLPLPTPFLSAPVPEPEQAMTENDIANAIARNRQLRRGVSALEVAGMARDTSTGDRGARNGAAPTPATDAETPAAPRLFAFEGASAERQ